MFIVKTARTAERSTAEAVSAHKTEGKAGIELLSCDLFPNACHSISFAELAGQSLSGFVSVEVGLASELPLFVLYLPLFYPVLVFHLLRLLLDMDHLVGL
jgi:hypothetical protein